MKKEIPGLLWIAIVSLALMVAFKVLAALSMHPVVLVDALLSGLLLAGIIHGHKWAYGCTVVFTVFGTGVGLAKGVEHGLAVLALDCLVLVPVLICTDYFFPKPAALPLGERKANSPM